MTGASGAPYAIRFLREAVTRYDQVYLILSDAARQVLEVETLIRVSSAESASQDLLGKHWPGLKLTDPRDFFSPPASGSFLHDGMVIVPCSMGTAGRIASGASDDLITRAADVCLKERRPLILVPRETPLSLIHLRNLAQLTEAGATVLPASPGFYNRPQSIEEMLDFVVARILQQLGQPHQLTGEWQKEE